MNKRLFDQLRKINGTLTQLQVTTLDSLIEKVGSDILYNLFGINKMEQLYTLSAAGFKLIAEFEGYRDKAYDDGVGVWTIGYGTIRYPNGVRVKKGDTCTKEQAEAYKKNDLITFENTVNKIVKVPLTQNQYDALVSLTYNIGAGAISSSTLIKELNKSNYKSAADQFLRWNRAGGRVLPGLTKRREKERALFLTK